MEQDTVKCVGENFSGTIRFVHDVRNGPDGFEAVYGVLTLKDGAWESWHVEDAAPVPKEG